MVRNITQEQAMAEAVRKAKRASSTHNRIPTHYTYERDSSGFGEMTERRQAARLGSARLLERIVALQGRAGQ